MHDAAYRHTLVDETRRRIRIVGRGENEHMTCLRRLDDISRNAAIPRDDEHGNPLFHAVDDGLIVTVADEHDVIFPDSFFDCLEGTCGNAHISLDEIAFDTIDEDLCIDGGDDVSIAHTHVGEVRHAELLEIAFGEVGDRHDTDEDALAVRHRHGAQIMIAHDFPQLT